MSCKPDKHAELWLRVKVGKRIWEVWLSDPGSFWASKKSAKLAGMCDYGAGEIYVNRRMKKLDRRRTLVHELFHAASYKQDAKHKRASKRGMDAVEEHFACLVDGPLFDALAVIGMLKPLGRVAT